MVIVILLCRLCRKPSERIRWRIFKQYLAQYFVYLALYALSSRSLWLEHSDTLKGNNFEAVESHVNKEKADSYYDLAAGGLLLIIDIIRMSEPMIRTEIKRSLKRNGLGCLVSICCCLSDSKVKNIDCLSESQIEARQ